MKLASPRYSALVGARGTRLRWRPIASTVLASVGVVVALVIPGAAASSPATTSATVTRGPIVVLSRAGENAEDPQLAMNGSGDYLIAWPQDQSYGPISLLPGSTSQELLAARVHAFGSQNDLLPLNVAVAPDGRRALDYHRYGRRLAPGVLGLNLALSAPGSSAWNRRILVSPRHELDPESGGGPVFDSHDRVLDSWVLDRDKTSRLRIAYQAAPGGSLVARTVFRDHTGGGIYEPQIALDAADRPVLAWDRGSVGRPVIVAAGNRARAAKTTLVRQAAIVIASDRSGRLRAAQLLRLGCELGSLVVAPSGEAAVAMTCFTASDAAQIYVSERSAGGRFRRPVLASGAGIDDSAPSLRIAGNGRIWLSWLHRRSLNPSTGSEQVRTQVSSAPFNARFGTPYWLTRYENQYSPPALIEGASGQVYLVGQDAKSTVNLRALKPGGSLGQTVALSPPGASFNQELAVDSRGRGIVTWGITLRHGGYVEARSFVLPS